MSDKKRSKETKNQEDELHEGDLNGNEEFRSLQEELAKVQDEAKQYYEGMLRERADFINYKRRTEASHEQTIQAKKADILKNFLTVLDNMDLAIQHKPENAGNEEWWKGIELVYRQLQGVLATEGMEPIKAQGEEFDPTIHEAVSHEDNDAVESGKVIGVVKQGYKLGDRIVRPALVRVAK
ncbi:MAG TPA: nucleotide exchange factor GrpE [Bellilinea sp.]|nr:nucleotide exchange factor GrpE [Bellilinea sp.]